MNSTTRLRAANAPRHAYRLFYSAALLVVAAACGGTSHMTDIRAANTQDVGAFDIANAHVNGDRLSAAVCMARAGSADEISDRVLHELMNKGYNRIDLDMIASNSKGETERRLVSWTPAQGKQMQNASPAGGENPCATAAGVPSARESEQERHRDGIETQTLQKSGSDSGAATDRSR